MRIARNHNFLYIMSHVKGRGSELFIIGLNAHSLQLYQECIHGACSFAMGASSEDGYACRSSREARMPFIYTLLWRSSVNIRSSEGILSSTSSFGAQPSNSWLARDATNSRNFSYKCFTHAYMIRSYESMVVYILHKFENMHCCTTWYAHVDVPTGRSAMVMQAVYTTMLRSLT